MEFSGSSMAEDFPGTTMGFTFTPGTFSAAPDPYEESSPADCDYVKWQGSQTACQALNHLIMTSANEPRLQVRLRDDELGIGTGSKGWQRQPSFDQIPEFSLLSTNDLSSAPFGLPSRPSSPKASSSRASSSKPSSRPPRSRPRPSDTKSRPSNETTNPDNSAPSLDKASPEHFLDVIKVIKTHADKKTGLHPRSSNSGPGVIASSSSSRAARTAPTTTAATTATRKRTRHASGGGASSDGTSQHGQAKRGRVGSDKGKGRASAEDLEKPKEKEMVKEKDYRVPLSRFQVGASGSGVASSSSGSGSRPREDKSDISLSMEVDGANSSLGGRSSTRSWTTDSPSILGSSASLSSASAESKSPSQKRMPPPPVPAAARLSTANVPSSRRSSAGGSASSRPITTLVPTQKESQSDLNTTPKFHPLLLNPPTKPSSSIISNSNLYSYPLGPQTKVNQPQPQPQGHPGSRQKHPPTNQIPDIPPATVNSKPAHNTTTATARTLKTEPGYGQPQAQLPVPLRGATTSKTPSSGTSSSATRTSNPVATTSAAGRTVATNLSSTPHSTAQSQPQQLSLSQSTRPPPLGMRRTNTFPAGGMGTGIGMQKPGALPTKQKGFRVPFIAAGNGNGNGNGNGVTGSQKQQQQQQPAAVSVVSSMPGGGASTPNSNTRTNAPSNSNTGSFSTASTASARYKANEQLSVQARLALSPPAPLMPVTEPASLPSPTDGDGDSSFDMSLSFDMDALEETMRLYD